MSADFGSTRLDPGRTWSMAAKLRAAMEPPLATAALILCGTLVLSWVALFNGAPLVFADTGAYVTAALDHEIPGMFSVFYAWLIWPLHQGISLWPVILAQAAIVTHLLYLTARCVCGGAVGRVETLLIVAALSIFSSLPWLTGEVMPDVFSPVLLLSIFLLAFCSGALVLWELLYVAVLAAAAVTAHFSHVPIAAALIVLGLGMRLAFVRERAPFRFVAALLVVPFLAAVSAMVTVNWIDSGRIGLSRDASVFFLAKLIADGPALRYLQDACPDAGYELCAQVAALPGLTQDDLKWAPDSPFTKIGGFDDVEPEARRIVAATAAAYPFAILKGALLDTGRQLVHTATGDGLSADFARMVAERVRDSFTDDAGDEVADAILQSRQGKGTLPLNEFQILHAGFLILALGFVAWALLARGRFLPRKLVLFAAFVGAGLVVNAALTGGLSGPYDRYFARVVWLVGFVALLSFRYAVKPHDQPHDRSAAIVPAA